MLPALTLSFGLICALVRTNEKYARPPDRKANMHYLVARIGSLIWRAFRLPNAVGRGRG
jgi:hypothetical protein